MESSTGFVPPVVRGWSIHVFYLEWTIRDQSQIQSTFVVVRK